MSRALSYASGHFVTPSRFTTIISWNTSLIWIAHSFRSSNLYSFVHLSLRPPFTLLFNLQLALRLALASILYQRKYQAFLHHTIEYLIKGTLSNLTPNDNYNHLSISACSHRLSVRITNKDSLHFIIDLLIYQLTLIIMSSGQKSVIGAQENVSKLFSAILVSHRH